MRQTAKPVRKCHACLLNLGDRCWRYASPRSQWRERRQCLGFNNAVLYAAYRTWLKRAQVKSRKELRRDAVGARKRLVDGGKPGFAPEDRQG
ncbi:MAG: hypothetical protein O3B24_01490 [Verrucomicrobia bacterium]|nr:hypothetical protein [Verrucomicrobiota bacterium]